MNIDANKVIDELCIEMASTLKENAMLKVQVNSLIKQNNELQPKEGKTKQEDGKKKEV